jgi:hypothetical protein
MHLLNRIQQYWITTVTEKKRLHSSHHFFLFNKPDTKTLKIAFDIFVIVTADKPWCN